MLAGAHAPTAASSGIGMSAADMWRVLRANAWLIIGLLMISAAAGWGVNFWLARYHSRYTASGYVGVEPIHRFDPLHPNANEYTDWSGLQIEQRTQAAMLTSETLFMSVLQKPELGIRDTGWFKQFVTLQKQADGSIAKSADIEKAKLDLIDRFSASAIPDSKLIM